MMQQQQQQQKKKKNKKMQQQPQCWRVNACLKNVHHDFAVFLMSYMYMPMLSRALAGRCNLTAVWLQQGQYRAVAGQYRAVAGQYRYSGH
jgi:hypothetical protein